MKKILLLLFAFSYSLASLYAQTCDPVGILINSYESFDGVNNSNGSTFSYELNPAVNRILVVGVSGEDFSGGGQYVSSVNYGGLVMKEATGLSNHLTGGRNNFVQFYYLDENDLTSLGNTSHSLVVSNTGRLRDYFVSVFILENVNQSKLIFETDTEINGLTLEVDLTADESTDFMVAIGSNAEQTEPYTFSGISGQIDEGNSGQQRYGLVYYDTPSSGVEHTISFENDLSRHAVAGFVVSKAFSNTCSLAPGGMLNDLVFWAKANDGLDCETDGCTVSLWKDQTESLNHATSVGTPVLTQNALNFNEGVEFVGAESDYLSLSEPADLPLGSSSRTYFIVSDGTGTGKDPAFGHGSIGTDAFFKRVDLTTSNDQVGVRISDNNNIISVSNSDPYVSTFTYSGGLFNGNFLSYQNGSLLANNYLYPGLGTSILNTGDQFAFIGRNTTQNANYDGTIFEVIVYEDDLTPIANGLQKIQSYLAAKYGIIIDHDLIDSDGTTFWDYGTENDVMTIGRDDASGLYQKQSKSSDDTLQIYVDDLKVNNNKNTGSITNDKSFLTFGGSDGYLSGRIDDDGFPIEVPTGIYSIFDRTWRVKNVNFSNTYSLDLKFDSIGTFDIADIRLLVSTTDDFTDGASPVIYADGDNGITIESGSIVISGIGTSILPMNQTRYFAIGSVSELTPLPIELIEFTADNKVDFVSLNWATASELNNDYFTLEKSEDGVNWIAFETIASDGDSKSITNYSYEDHTPYAPITYYRLKQTDFDGTFTYSKIVTVQFQDDFMTGIEIYPNPSSGHHIHLDIEDKLSDVANIKIVDVLGRELMSEKPHDYVSGQSYKLNFDSKLPSGSYIMRVELSNGEVHVVTFTSF